MYTSQIMVEEQYYTIESNAQGKIVNITTKENGNNKVLNKQEMLELLLKLLNQAVKKNYAKFDPNESVYNLLLGLIEAGQITNTDEFNEYLKQGNFTAQQRDRLKESLKPVLQKAFHEDNQSELKNYLDEITQRIKNKKDPKDHIYINLTVVGNKVYAEFISVNIKDQTQTQLDKKSFNYNQTTRDEFLTPLFVRSAETGETTKNNVMVDSMFMANYEFENTNNIHITLNNVGADYAREISEEVSRTVPLYKNDSLAKKKEIPLEEEQREEATVYAKEDEYVRKRVPPKNNKAAFISITFIAYILGVLGFLISYIAIIISK